MFEIGYPITGLGRPLGFQEVEAPSISRQLAQEGGEIVNPMNRPSKPPGDTPGVHFCYRLSRTYCYSAAGIIQSMKNTNDLIGNRIRNLQTCNEVPQLTAPLNNRDICYKHKRKIQNLFFYYS